MLSDKGSPFTDTKILAFPERIAEWLRTGSTWPIVVDFDMTNTCNHRCPGCPGGWVHDVTAEWSYGGAIGVLGQFLAGGTKAVSFGGGGEPLMNSATPAVIRTITDWGMSAGLITNGGRDIDAFVPTLADRCSWIRLSLDAGAVESYSRIHGVSGRMFEHALDNLKKLATYPDRKAVVGVGFLTSEAMSVEMFGAAELAKEAGADYIQYRPYNGDTFNVLPLAEEIRSQLEDLSFKVYASVPKYIRMGRKRTAKICHAQHFNTVVTANGLMYRCCDFKNLQHETPIGDLKKQTVVEVLASQERKAALGEDISNCPPLCRNNAINELLETYFINRPKHAEFL